MERHVAMVDVPALDVRPGDALVDEQSGVIVTGEPVTMHAGLGLFDEPELYVGLPVHAQGQRPILRRFAPDQLVRVRRAAR